MDIIQLKFGNWAIPYIYFYVFISNLVALSMFIGVIVQTFNEKMGIALLTNEQKKWEDLKKRIFLINPILEAIPADNYLRKKVFYIANSMPVKILESFFIFSLILIDMTISSVDESQINQIFIKNICLLCIVFCLIVIHFCTFFGIGVMQHLKFYKIQSIVDILLFIVLLMTLNMYNQPYKLQILNYCIVFLLLIYFILFCFKWQKLKSILLTIFKSILKSFYLLLVLMILTQFYALIGVVIFGLTRHSSGFNQYFNFHTSLNSLYILFAVANGDGWPNYLFDAAIEYPYCTLATNINHSDCGNFILAIIFFVSYVVNKLLKNKLR